MNESQNKKALLTNHMLFVCQSSNAFERLTKAFLSKRPYILFIYLIIKY